MKKIYIFMLFALVCSLYADDYGIDTEPQEGDIAGRMKAVTGDVKIYNPGEADKAENADINTLIMDDQIVETGPGSSAIIELPSRHGYVFAEASTKVAVSYFRSVRSHKVVLLLDEGTVRAYSPELEEMRSHFTVITPNASIGTPGGDFAVVFTSGNTLVKSYKNYCAVKYLPKELTGEMPKAFLAEGEKMAVSTAREGISGSRAFVMDAEEKSFWKDKGVKITYKKDETRQAVIIKEEIKKIQTAPLTSRALKRAI